MSPKTDVLVVEDHELLAQTVQVALGEEGIVADVVVPRSHEDVLAAVRHSRPTLVLLDLDLGSGVGEGTTVLPAIVELGARVIVVTGVTDLVRVGAAVEAGAIGYLPKSAPFDDLLGVIRAGLSGRSTLTDAQRFELLAALRRHRAADHERWTPFERLSPREQGVLRELADGQGVADIAARRGVSQATVRTQVRGILTKLGVTSQLTAVAMARRSGWLTGSPPSDEPEAPKRHWPRRGRPPGSVT